MDASVRYSSLLPTSLSFTSHNVHTVGRGLNEGAMIRELIGRLGSNNVGCNEMSSPGGPPKSSSQSPGAGADKSLTRESCWNSVDVPTKVNLTVDPSKGGLSLQGGGLATSHCIEQFSSDPGFAERAARFSSFGTAKYMHGFPCDNEKIHPRSVGVKAVEVDCNLVRASSCSPHSGSSVSKELSEVSPDAIVCQDRNTNVDDFRIEKSKHTGDESGEKKPGEKSLCRTSSNCAAVQVENVVSIEVPANELGSDPTSAHETSSSEQHSEGGSLRLAKSGNQSVAKKRKSKPVDKPNNSNMGCGSVSSLRARDAKTAEFDDLKVKRLKRGELVKDKEEGKLKVERSSSENSENSCPFSAKESLKTSESPKLDYIHVRARRGQATDSHSLAERVRREKISERMKYLQDLVPGCNKVTGKAMMLDEIINYVQSLQHQVELLSMKLASVNPRPDIHLDSFMVKEMSHTRGPSLGRGSDNIVSYSQFHLQHQAQLQHGVTNGLDFHPLGSPPEATLRRSMSAPVAAPLESFMDSVPQSTHVWDDGELQSIVQMGYGHRAASLLQGLHRHLPPGHMKAEP